MENEEDVQDVQEGLVGRVGLICLNTVELALEIY
jgi:hypothetical protein